MLERRPFGRTGHESSCVIFGAAALAAVSQETADLLLPHLDLAGVNHLDTAASYGDAELRLAPWLRRRRGDFFLATKTDDRTADGARRSLERSLERLGVDHVDLIQLHNLVEEDEWETAHGSDGALAGLLRAREEGLTRFLGVTGHGLRIAGMHLRSLARFDYDSVLFPYNHALARNDGYRRTVDELLAVADERGTAVQVIKAVARRRFTGPPSDGEERYSWYEPLRDEGAISRAVAFVLGLPGAFLVSSSEWSILGPILEAALSGEPPPAEAVLEEDATTFGVTALFDGGMLERI